MKKRSRYDLWNPIIKIRDKHKGTDIAKKAELLLKQFNTAGGRMISEELEEFINEYENLKQPFSIFI